MENIRYYKAEEAKDDDMTFAEELAKLGDFYVNDAFGTAHRAHASTALIADYFDADHKMFGYLMEKEVKAVDKVLNDIQRPFTAIMGGSKVSSKIPVIENLLDKVDTLIIGGGMAYTFMAAHGEPVGKSLLEEDYKQYALDMEKKAEEKGVKLDTELTAEDLKDLVAQFKAIYKEQKGEDFPQDSRVQLMEAVKAVFRSWNNARAITYRRLNDIPGSWGTAVNVQEMVFGNCLLYTSPSPRDCS